MKVKYFFLIILFQIAAHCVYGQNIDDIIQRQETGSEQNQPAEPKSRKAKKAKEEQPAPVVKTEEKEEITLALDLEIPKGRSSSDAAADDDSPINAKWKKYLAERTQEIGMIYDNLLQVDTTKVTKAIIDDFTIELEKVKEKFDFKLSNDELWKDNDELDDMRSDFTDSYGRAIKKLNYLEGKVKKKKEPMNPLHKWGIALIAFLVALPIFGQIKAKFTVKNAKKQAELLAKKQLREAERQVLLSDEANIIKLK